MPTRRPLTLLLILALAACSDDTSSGKDAGGDGSSALDLALDSGGHDTLPPDSTPPDQLQPDSSTIQHLLTSANHPGYGQTSCTGAKCHTLPVQSTKRTHTETRSPQCTACHGGNGACDPNGINSGYTKHTSGLNCTGCHGSRHGYSSRSDCVSCHFAAGGLEQCS